MAKPDASFSFGHGAIHTGTYVDYLSVIIMVSFESCHWAPQQTCLRRTLSWILKAAPPVSLPADCVFAVVPSNDDVRGCDQPDSAGR